MYEIWFLYEIELLLFSAHMFAECVVYLIYGKKLPKS